MGEEPGWAIAFHLQPGCLLLRSSILPLFILEGSDPARAQSANDRELFRRRSEASRVWPPGLY